MLVGQEEVGIELVGLDNRGIVKAFGQNWMYTLGWEYCNIRDNRLENVARSAQRFPLLHLTGQVHCLEINILNGTVDHGVRWLPRQVVFHSADVVILHLEDWFCIQCRGVAIPTANLLVAL